MKKMLFFLAQKLGKLREIFKNCAKMTFLAQKTFLKVIFPSFLSIEKTKKMSTFLLCIKKGEVLVCGDERCVGMKVVWTKNSGDERCGDEKFWGRKILGTKGEGMKNSGVERGCCHLKTPQKAEDFKLTSWLSG